jgi:hypothetical protein
MWSCSFAMAAIRSSTVGSFLLGRFLFVVCIVVLRVERIAIQASVRAPSKVIP